MSIRFSIDRTSKIFFFIYDWYINIEAFKFAVLKLLSEILEINSCLYTKVGLTLITFSSLLLIDFHLEWLSLDHSQ